MNINISIYVKVFLLTVLYYLVLNGTTLILFKTIDINFFDTPSKIHIIDLIPVLLTTLLVVFGLKKTLKTNKKKLNKPLNLLYIIGFVLLIRFFNDPIYRFFEVFNLAELPKQVEQKTTHFSLQIFFILKVILLVPLLEELFFRGIILNSLLSNKKSTFLSITISSILFAAIHYNPMSINYITIATAFTFSLIAGMIYIRYGFIYVVIFHILHNSLWFIIRENNALYWDILNKLNFGFFYWLLVFISLLIILVIYRNFLLKSNKV